MECIYNAEEELFMVHKIMPLSADRKVSNIKRGFTIEGVIKFIDNRRRFNLSRISENNNEKLIIQFKNNKKINLHYKNRMSYLIICLDIGQRDWMNQ